jgi:hypothetical protein
MTDDFKKRAKHVARLVTDFLAERVARGNNDGAREAEGLLHHLRHYLLVEFLNEPATELQRAREQHAQLLSRRAKMDAAREQVSDAAIAAARQQIVDWEAALERKEKRAAAREATKTLDEFKRLGEAFDAGIAATWGT